MTKRIKLAIVDDHEMMRNTWKMVLERDERIEIVAECASGAEAIACATHQQPDVMLMDVNMKPLNGFEATGTIMNQQSKVKIIGFSINNLPVYARSMLQLGAKGFVTKSIDAEEMFTAIETVNNGGIYICGEVKNKMLI